MMKADLYLYGAIFSKRPSAAGLRPPTRCEVLIARGNAPANDGRMQKVYHRAELPGSFLIKRSEAVEPCSDQREASHHDQQCEYSSDAAGYVVVIFARHRHRNLLGCFFAREDRHHRSGAGLPLLRVPASADSLVSFLA